MRLILLYEGRHALSLPQALPCLEARRPPHAAGPQARRRHDAGRGRQGRGHHRGRDSVHLADPKFRELMAYFQAESELPEDERERLLIDTAMAELWHLVDMGDTKVLLFLAYEADRGRIPENRLRRLAPPLPNRGGLSTFGEPVADDVAAEPVADAVEPAVAPPLLTPPWPSPPSRRRRPSRPSPPSPFPIRPPSPGTPRSATPGSAATSKAVRPWLERAGPGRTSSLAPLERAGPRRRSKRGERKRRSPAEDSERRASRPTLHGSSPGSTGGPTGWRDATSAWPVPVSWPPDHVGGRRGKGVTPRPLFVTARIACPRAACGRPGGSGGQVVVTTRLLSHSTASPDPPGQAVG